jgi:hypothetical protein
MTDDDVVHVVRRLEKLWEEIRGLSAIIALLHDRAMIARRDATATRNECRECHRYLQSLHERRRD